MLEISLRPAAVAHGDIDERLRASLIGSVAIDQQTHLPSGATEEGGLDKIVALYVAAERRTSGEMGQPTRSRKSRGADNGVVAPVVAALLMPRREAGRDHGTIERDSELLQPRQQGLGADESGHGLH